MVFGSFDVRKYTKDDDEDINQILRGDFFVGFDVGKTVN